MEHIVQFAVSVDDDRIQKIMEESAAKQVADDIKAASHGLSYYDNGVNKEPEKLKALFSDEIAKYVKEHADEIVKLVVAEVSKNMMKTKKIKEAIDSITEETTDDGAVISD